MGMEDKVSHLFHLNVVIADLSPVTFANSVINHVLRREPLICTLLLFIRKKWERFEIIHSAFLCMKSPTSCAAHRPKSAVHSLANVAPESDPRSSTEVQHQVP